MEHREELRKVLERYKDVITERLGNVRGTEHEIRMGISNSIKCTPYRLAPGWRQVSTIQTSSGVEAGVHHTD